MTPLGIRNNNPLNIRRVVGTKWKGEVQSNSHFVLFSSLAWGAWSVAIISIVPSFRPSMIASLSASSRSGGFIFAFVPYLIAASSVSVK